MYQRAQALGKISFNDVNEYERLSSLQADAYVVAINALCLLDARNAWISIPSPEDGLVLEQWKIADGFVPDYQSSSRPVANVVELEDIRTEYQLHRSRRELYDLSPLTGNTADLSSTSVRFLLACLTSSWEQFVERRHCKFCSGTRN